VTALTIQQFWIAAAQTHSAALHETRHGVGDLTVRFATRKLTAQFVRIHLNKCLPLGAMPAGHSAAVFNAAYGHHAHAHAHALARLPTALRLPLLPCS